MSRAETFASRPKARRILLRLEELESRLAPATVFSIANSSALEPAPGGTVNLDFIVSRSGDLTSQVTVGYTTVSGTAQPGRDFTPTTGTTTFASGSPTATIAIPIFGNGVYNNPDLTFSVELTGITNVVGPPVTFAAAANTATGTHSYSVTVADFNGDGKPDVAVANYGADTVSVLLNTTAPGAAAPTFAAKVDFATAAGPLSVTVGDFNGDGKPDLITGNDSGGFGSISVLLNTTPTGSAVPSFGAHADVFTGPDPNFVAVADFNGDGKPDLVALNPGYNSAMLITNATPAGAATPSFGAYSFYSTGSKPAALAIGDFNGDGKPDFAVANENSNSVSVFLNTTAPGATPPTFSKTDFAAGSNPVYLAVGDLNGDGKLDIAVADNTGGTPSIGYAAVLLNTTATGATTPAFNAPQTFTTATNPVAVTIADLNGDGKPDLVVVNATDNNASVLLNATLPGANLVAFNQQMYGVGAAPRSAAVADLNGDGLPDLIVADDGGGPGSVTVLLNTTYLGASTVLPSFPQAGIAPTSSPPVSITAGDLNGDGKPDLVVALTSSYSVAVLLNATAPGAATTTFAPAVNFALGAGANPLAVAIADVNGDGQPDLVVAYANGILVLLNATPAGSLSPVFDAAVAVDSLPNITSLTVADFTGDGRPDIAVGLQGGDSDSAYAVVLTNTTMPGATTPSFDTEVFYSAGFGIGSTPTSIAAADLNGDGRPDLVVTVNNGGASYASVLINSTTPGAQAASFDGPTTIATGNGPESVAVGDLNGDGRPDLVVANESSGNVTVLLNSTPPGAMAPKFGPAVNFHTGMAPASVAVADLNGDGKPEIVVTDRAYNTAGVLLNTTAPGAATASFAPVANFAIGYGPLGFLASQDVAVGDFNGDGRPDLAVANANVNYAAVLLNTPGLILPGSLSPGATGTITEDDPPPTVQFSTAGETVDVSAGTFSITVTLSAVSGDDTTIPFTLGGTAVNGVNYSNVTASPLVIPAGQTTATISGTLIDDGQADTATTLTFTLGTPTNGTLGGTITNTLTIAEPAAVASSIVFLQPPAGATTLQPISPDILVQVLDQYGHPLDDGVVTVVVAVGSPAGFDPASTVTVETDDNGVADFNNLILDVAGTYSLTAVCAAAVADSPSFTASAANVNLVVDPSELSSNVPTIAVGDSFNISGNFSDLGAVPLQAVVSWGDGSTTDAAVNVTNQQGQFEAQHAYANEGSFPLSVALEDAQGRIVAFGALSGPVQVVPAHFGPVNVIYAQPGQTVTQSVTDPSTGTTIIVSLSLPAGDAGGGYLLVTQLNIVLPALTGNIVQDLASFDVRQFNLPGNATAAIAFGVPGSLPAGTTGQLLYLDRETDPAHPSQQTFQGFTLFFNGPSVVFGVNQFSTPKITDLTGTVFTIAASVPGATTAAAISAPVVSSLPNATAPTQTTIFRTTSSLTLTLEPSQAGQVSSGLSMLSTNDVGGAGGGGDEGSAAADALFQFLIQEWDYLPKLFSLLDSMDPGRTTAAPAAPAAPTPAVTPNGSQSRMVLPEPMQPVSALELFLNDPPLVFDRFTTAAPAGEVKMAARKPAIAHRNPVALGEEAVVYATAVGVGLSVLGREKREKSGRLEIR